MTEIRIEIDDAAVQRLLARAIAAGRDLTPAMRNIAGFLESAAQLAFVNQAAPDGTPWADLSPATKTARAKRGTWPGQILQVTGQLSNSITSAFGPDFAEAGSNVVYAGTHQFGTARGAFGATARGAPIPWGDIPARPFLGLADAGENEVVAILTRHINGG